MTATIVERSHAHTTAEPGAGAGTDAGADGRIDAGRGRSRRSVVVLVTLLLAATSGALFLGREAATGAGAEAGITHLARVTSLSADGTQVCVAVGPDCGPLAPDARTPSGLAVGDPVLATETQVDGDFAWVLHAAAGR